MTASELYDSTSYDLARQVTLRYSSSFGMASRLFGRAIRHHIYAIYGMVRVADEIVDTYTGIDKAELLKKLRSEVHQSIATGYSTNPIIHAFSTTARQFGINKSLIDPFFDSMQTDLTRTQFTTQQYNDYIYGSAEVVGLMCLKVFCNSNQTMYENLLPGATALGSAYQKVNFLRDFASDYNDRGRIYFPGVTITSWDGLKKQAIIDDITRDFNKARPSITSLPASARTAVYVSFLYYQALLRRLNRMTSDDILRTRAHVPAILKIAYLLAAPIGVRL